MVTPDWQDWSDEEIAGHIYRAHELAGNRFHENPQAFADELYYLTAYCLTEMAALAQDDRRPDITDETLWHITRFTLKLDDLDEASHLWQLASLILVATRGVLSVYAEDGDRFFYQGGPAPTTYTARGVAEPVVCTDKSIPNRRLDLFQAGSIDPLPEPPPNCPQAELVELVNQQNRLSFDIPMRNDRRVKGVLHVWIPNMALSPDRSSVDFQVHTGIAFGDRVVDLHWRSTIFHRGSAWRRFSLDGLSAKEKQQVWGTLFAQLIPRTRHQSASKSTFDTTSPLYLPAGRPVLDRNAQTAMSVIGDLGLPRDWPSIPTEGELQRECVERLKQQHGDKALEEGIIEITPHGARLRGRELRNFNKSLVGRWHRKANSSSGELLAKRVSVRGGYVEVTIDEDGYRLLATGSRPRSRYAEDARRVLDVILRRFGLYGLNPVEIGVAELAQLLDCTSSSRKLPRIDAALNALKKFNFGLKFAGVRDWGGGKGEGVAVGGWIRVDKGRGGHGDGYYRIEITDTFIGALIVFRAASAANEDGYDTYSFTSALTPDGKRDLGARGGYTRGLTANAAHIFKAPKYSPQQIKLYEFIECNMTLNRDPGRGQKFYPAGPDNKLRLYTSQFCPALPEGQKYSGALGHFKRSPESGWKTETLAQTIGHDLSSHLSLQKYTTVVGQLIDDLQLVVEGVFAGQVVVRYEGKWYPLNNLPGVTRRDLAKRGRWYLFTTWDPEQRLNDLIEASDQQGPVRVVPLDGARYAARASDTAPDTAVPLGEQLRVERLRRDLSLERVSEDVGRHRSTLHRYEKTGQVPAEMLPVIEKWIAESRRL